MFSVIFDMDGTLLDTQRVCVDAWEYAGILQEIKGVGECLPEVCGMNEPGWTDYLKQNYPTMDTDVFKKNIKEYILKNENIEFKKGTRELIDFLKENNVKIAVASGSSASLIKRNFEKLGAFRLFDATVGGDEVKCGKPSPDIFLLAAEKIGAKAEECFVFEDSKNGILAGFNAGMKCIGVPDIAQFPDSIKDKMYAEVTTLSDAIDILKKHL